MPYTDPTDIHHCICQASLALTDHLFGALESVSVESELILLQHIENGKYGVYEIGLKLFHSYFASDNQTPLPTRLSSLLYFIKDLDAKSIIACAPSFTTSNTQPPSLHHIPLAIEKLKVNVEKAHREYMSLPAGHDKEAQDRLHFLKNQLEKLENPKSHKVVSSKGLEEALTPPLLLIMNRLTHIHDRTVSVFSPPVLGVDRFTHFQDPSPNALPAVLGPSSPKP